jgi:hypothetical protein
MQITRVLTVGTRLQDGVVAVVVPLRANTPSSAAAIRIDMVIINLVDSYVYTYYTK